LAKGRPPGPNARERQLQDEVEELKAALGEAHIELRVWKKNAERRLGPSRVPGLAYLALREIALRVGDATPLTPSERKLYTR